MDFETTDPGLESSAPETGVEGGAPESVTPEQPAASEPIYLSKLEKFRFDEKDEKDWTLKDLQQSMMLHKDYTQKNQALSAQRKYLENLHYDLQHVLKNPGLAGDFRKTYPKEFHAHLDRVLKSNPQAAGQPAPTIDQNLLNRLETFEERIARFEKEKEEAELTVQTRELDEKFSTLGKKYEYADADRVEALATQYVSQGNQLTDEVLEKIFKLDHDKDKKRIEGMIQNKINAQKNVNSKMRDSGAGGSIPGQAPKKPRNIKEATRMFLESEGLS